MVQELSERRAIRETFVSKEAPNALRMLVIERNVRPDDKHEEHYALSKPYRQIGSFVLQ